MAWPNKAGILSDWAQAIVDVRHPDRETQGVMAERMRRLRLDRERSLDAPAWLFSAGELPFDATVLPLDTLRQAPLSAVDEKPMRRASATQLRQLLAEEKAAGNHEMA